LIDPAGGRSTDLAICRATTDALSAIDLEDLVALLSAAFDDLEPEDVDHAMGGVHWLAEAGGRLVGHVSVVPRILEADGTPIRTGYVEAVGVAPDWQRRDVGTRLMAEADAHIAAAYELGALGTGEHAFYERLGWERWQGPTFERTADGDRRTPEEDDSVMVLRVAASPALTLRERLSCEWRQGASW
jgi:aminoglycoside 2'-N-acetyltransferase I